MRTAHRVAKRRRCSCFFCGHPKEAKKISQVSIPTAIFYPPLAPCHLVPPSSTTSSSLDPHPRHFFGSDVRACTGTNRGGAKRDGGVGVTPWGEGEEEAVSSPDITAPPPPPPLPLFHSLPDLEEEREEGGAPRAKVGPKICLMPPMRGEGRECLNFGHMIMTMMAIQENLVSFDILLT